MYELFIYTKIELFFKYILKVYSFYKMISSILNTTIPTSLLTFESNRLQTKLNIYKIHNK